MKKGNLFQSKNPDIVDLIIFLPSLNGGGAERAFVDLANQFVNMGKNVQFILVNASGPYLSDLSDKIIIINLDRRSVFSSLLLLARYLKKINPKAVLSGLDNANIVAVLASFLAGLRKRCFISQRAVLLDLWDSAQYEYKWIWSILVKLVYPYAAGIICNSIAAKDELIGRFGIKPSLIAVIYNFVDLSKINNKALEPLDKLWVSVANAGFVLSVGSLTARKDPITLLKAFALIANKVPHNLVFVGEGPYSAIIMSQADKLAIKDRVFLVGFDPNPFRWMTHASLLVSSSLAEGCPNVIQQALAVGTPIVATNCPGGSAEILEYGKWGRLVGVKNPYEMSDAILASLTENKVTIGQLRAKEFSPAVISKQYLSFMRLLNYTS